MLKCANVAGVGLTKIAISPQAERALLNASIFGAGLGTFSSLRLARQIVDQKMKKSPAWKQFLTELGITAAGGTLGAAAPILGYAALDKFASGTLKGLGLGSGVDPESTVTTKPQPKDVGAEASKVNAIGEAAASIYPPNKTPNDPPKSVVNQTAIADAAPTITRSTVLG